MKQILLFLWFISLSSIIIGCATPVTTETPATIETTTPVVVIVSQIETPTISPETPPETPPPPPTETPTPSPQTLPAEAVDLGPIETYQDITVGFALDYPTGWILQSVDEAIKAQSQVYSAVLMSWQPNEGGVHGIPEGSSKMDILVVKSAPDTLEATVAQWKTQMGPTPILSQQTVTLPSGLMGVYMALEMPTGQPQAALFVTNINNHTVVLSGLGNLEIFQNIARTLRRL